MQDRSQPEPKKTASPDEIAPPIDFNEACYNSSVFEVIRDALRLKADKEDLKDRKNKARKVLPTVLMLRVKSLAASDAKLSEVLYELKELYSGNGLKLADDLNKASQGNLKVRSKSGSDSYGRGAPRVKWAPTNKEKFILWKMLLEVDESFSQKVLPSLLTAHFLPSKKIFMQDFIRGLNIKLSDRVLTGLSLAETSRGYEIKLSSCIRFLLELSKPKTVLERLRKLHIRIINQPYKEKKGNLNKSSKANRDQLSRIGLQAEQTLKLMVLAIHHSQAPNTYLNYAEYIYSKSNSEENIKEMLDIYENCDINEFSKRLPYISANTKKEISVRSQAIKDYAQLLGNNSATTLSDFLLDYESLLVQTALESMADLPNFEQFAADKLLTAINEQAATQQEPLCLAMLFWTAQYDSNSFKVLQNILSKVDIPSILFYLEAMDDIEIYEGRILSATSSNFHDKVSTASFDEILMKYDHEKLLALLLNPLPSVKTNVNALINYLIEKGHAPALSSKIADMDWHARLHLQSLYDKHAFDW